MLTYLARRLVLAAITVFAITLVTFAILHLPPVDFVTAYAAQAAASGSSISAAEADAMRLAYGLNQPLYVQYWKWLSDGRHRQLRPFLRIRPTGHRGHRRPPVAHRGCSRSAPSSSPGDWPCRSASTRRSGNTPFGDYIFTFLGFIGLAIPNFLLALIVMYFGLTLFGISVGGLFSADQQLAPWSWAKVFDLLHHLPVPILILSLAGTAQLVRIMRANLLDELRRPYVVTARARGLPERRVIMKYPVRAAMNPFASTIGYLLPFTGLRLDHHFRRAESADRWSAAAAFAAVAGHAAGVHHHPAARRTDGGRHAVVRSAADVDRSTHPAGPDAMSEAVITEPLVTEAETRVAVATQRQLIWWRFRKHKLAVVSAVIVGLFYLVALFADVIAYAPPFDTQASRSYIPPQPIHWFNANGSFDPHVYALKGKRDMRTFKLTYAPDPSEPRDLVWFAHGYPYSFLGLFPTDIHLFGVSDGKPENALFLLGTDQLGRDVFSRLVLATRTSLTIGLVGVTLSLVLGVLLGGISGLQGGWADTVIQRVIEILRSIPTIPLWMGLAAAVPASWSPQQVYFAITMIISLIGWTELARVVRGRFLALREEDFIVAAELAGASRLRIIFKHMVPSFLSHIIAAVSLALPAMIISETTLSFLGLGLRPPAISWGVMLQDAQNLQTLGLAPWLLFAAVPVIVVILAFNFLGDGLRDAADPYG